MSEPKASDEVRKFLSAIGSKGGKQKTPKKLAQFAAIQSKGSYSVTPKKLAHLAKARAARLAKIEARKKK